MQPRVAYFCMEFGLNEDLPIYAGGLGILAGDYMKSCGDLKLPVTGIGLYWGHGYTQQRIGQDGYPYDEFPATHSDKVVDTGKRVSVPVQGLCVTCRILEVKGYGTAPLYLLAPIEAEHLWITERLYGGSAYVRVAQEILLGIGGVRALRALGIDVQRYHFNEGHAVFAGVELIRERMKAGASFEQALAGVREQIVFTTHTPVEAGNEVHPHDILQTMNAYGTLTTAQMKQLGGDPFNMTVAGLRLSSHANAVAQLHGETARAMWAGVDHAAPIVAVTNGVHAPTWQDARVRAVAKQGDFWAAHQACKNELFAEIEKRNGVKLRPDVLTIGFARRAAPYKRSDLIFRKPDRIAKYLREGKVQLIFSGKAHPQDELGKRIVANLYKMAREFSGQVVFIQNYDMHIGRLLTRGCDVWLNNPRRPLEASGTSGMKAAMNGVLNLSVLDGWWPEGCEHGVNGWKIGDGYEGPDADEKDLDSLYAVLENEVMPAYANPEKWVSMARASIEMSHWRFSSDRMVQDYFSQLYAPEAGVKRAAS
ncbi:MAG: alpha-glucan family phosphorylase [Deltaproteobacteria bacterium]|nr:alpha-glucan family phosphorylase [Deltaproteobacteria bacterium]